MRRSILSTLGILFSALVYAQAPSFVELDPFPGCAGSGTSIAVSYSGGSATSTLWEMSTDGGSTWSPVSPNATYTISTYGPGNFRNGPYGAWLHISGLTVSMNHYQYRITLSNAAGSSGPSIPLTLTVSGAAPNPAVFDNPATSVCQGQSPLYPFTENYKDDSIYWGSGATVQFDTWDTNGTTVYFPNTGNYSVSAYIFNGCGGVSTSVGVTVNPLSSALAGPAGGGPSCSTSSVFTGHSYGSYYTYPTTYTDGSCQPMSVITPSGASPVTGNIQSCVTVDATVQSYNGTPYVPRHYSLEPAVDAATSTATVTLYYTQADFDEYNAARGSSPALPAGPGDAAGIANLHITQYHGTGTTPDTYVGGSGDIDPDDSKIVWNAGASRWEVTFDITGFSGFFASGSPIAPLPLTLTAFSGQETAGGNQLHWTTTMEENTAWFGIEKKGSGDFVEIGKVAAAGNSDRQVQYGYTDAAGGNARYRLKMTDADGKFTYSRIVALSGKITGLSIRILPNPSSQPQSLMIGSPSTSSAVLTVTDMGGRRLQEKRLALQKGENSIDPALLSGLPQGIYFIGVATGQGQQTVKFIKD